MLLTTQTTNQETLTIPIPPHLRDTRIIISVTPDTTETNTVTAWQKIRAVLQQAHDLDMPHKTHEELMTELRSFRESE